jgi:hypothetical protein
MIYTYHIYLCVYIYTGYTLAYIHIYICIYVYICIYMHIYIFIYICVYMCVYIYIYIYIYICIFIYTYVCVCVWICISTCIYMLPTKKKKISNSRLFCSSHPSRTAEDSGIFTTTGRILFYNSWKENVWNLQIYCSEFRQWLIYLNTHAHVLWLHVRVLWRTLEIEEENESGGEWMNPVFVYYESIKREIKTRPIYECRWLGVMKD